MRMRSLGPAGPQVSAIGYGAMGLSGTYGPADEAEGIAVIRRALDLGVNLIDTAESYGSGHNERLVGSAIAGRRNEVFLATKFGGAGGPPTVGGKGRPENVLKAIEGSLARLGVDHIDLYYLHRVDRETPIEETVGAMARLVTQGKVRYLGLSEAAPGTLRRAAAVHPITALQSEYSLFSRDVEVDILSACRELDIGFVAYSPLGRGMLTGQLRSAAQLAEGDWRRSSAPRFQGEQFVHNLALVERIAPIAAEKGVEPGQLALAWLLHQGPHIVPIPGTRRRERLDANVAAAAIELTDADLRRLDESLPPGAAAGERYPPEGMRRLDL